MPSHDSKQTGPSEGKTELFLRFSRRGLMIVLFMLLLLGATVLGRAMWPNSILATWPSHAPSLLPVLTVILVAVMLATLRGRAWDPKDPEVKRILQDEFRQENLSRAQRAALIVVLAAQVPLGLLFHSLPAAQSVTAMATATIILGMATMITLFLAFDRE